MPNKKTCWLFYWTQKRRFRRANEKWCLKTQLIPAGRSKPYLFYFLLELVYVEWGWNRIARHLTSLPAKSISWPDYLDASRAFGRPRLAQRPTVPSNSLYSRQTNEILSFFIWANTLIVPHRSRSFHSKLQLLWLKTPPLLTIGTLWNSEMECFISRVYHPGIRLSWWRKTADIRLCHVCLTPVPAHQTSLNTT